MPAHSSFYIRLPVVPTVPAVRQVSLMVHPDKCKHARAKAACEVIGAAVKDLDDEEKRAKLSFLLNHAKGGIRGGWLLSYELWKVPLIARPLPPPVPHAACCLPACPLPLLQRRLRRSLRKRPRGMRACAWRLS